MPACLRLEQFGGNVPWPVGRLYPAPWVARITGLDRRYGFRREFVEPDPERDYLNANSVGSRGVFLIYWLDDGVYEVAEKVSWHRSRRYYLLVVGDETREFERQDVVDHFSSGGGRGQATDGD